MEWNNKQQTWVLSTILETDQSNNKVHAVAEDFDVINGSWIATVSKLTLCWDCQDI